jgi:branched-chain amino acid transport system substrate-binding protein
LDLVYRAQASLAVPDYTSNCQSAQAAGAQTLLIDLDPNSIQRVARSCASVNYHPQYVTTSVAAPPPGNPDLNGIVVSQNVLPWFVTNNPGIAEYQTVLRRYAPALRFNSSTIQGWVAAKLFQLAAAHVSDPPTSQSILDGLWSIKSNDLGGMTMPLIFTVGQIAPMTLCYWVTQIQGDQYISPNGAQRTCE